MDQRHFISFTLFLKGETPPEFAELDSICLSKEFFNDQFCIQKVLPLYFHFTRNNEKIPIAKLKRLFGCGADLIYRVKKAVEQRTPIRVPSRGKKPIRNDPVLRRLVDETTSANGHVSDTELSTLLGTSRSTVNNIRHDLNYKYKPLRHGPVLSQRQVDARLAFCRTNVDQDWTTVMFTDESGFSTSPDSPVMWWVKRGHHVYVETEKFPPSIMVWGGIIGPQKTPLILCPQRLNAEAYVLMLEQHRIHTFIGGCGENSQFQQDGARCHTAVSTMRWFRDNRVNVLPGWPANSPDLSPVEQIWSIMKRFILQWFGMRRPLSLQQLNEAVFDAFARINWKTIAILTLSAKFRVQACIQRNGGFVGDLIGECCRRARVEIETSSDIVLLSVPFVLDENGQNVDSSADMDGVLGENTTPTLPTLPSFGH